MPFNLSRAAIYLFVAIAAISRSAAQGELTADQLVLIVNKNVPDSAQLAEYYAKTRDVPSGRILSLDLPTGDEITFEQYEQSVVPEVRKFLESNELAEKVRCAVTFYGVPLRIRGRAMSPDDQSELNLLRSSIAQVLPKLRSLQAEVEKQAAALDPTFQPLRVAPAASAQVETIARQLEHATQALLLSVQRIDDPKRRDQKSKEIAQLMQQLRDVPTPPPSTQPTTTQVPATQVPVTQAGAGEDLQFLNLPELIARRFNPAARRRVRELAMKEGLLNYARTLMGQIEYLTPTATEAAFDNELALLWWLNYARPQWIPNALNYRFAGVDTRTPPVLMVSRLDAPTVQIVRDMIATSVQIEKRGLSGRIVIDTGGAAKLDPQRKQPVFWDFNRTFTNLALLLRHKGGALQVTYDEGPEVLPPHSVKAVAVYTGWYSVGQYVPSCDFSAGAVAYHIASYELTSLHDTNNHGWCRGLLTDGAVATIGPVSEPYLHAFPTPDDFVPLLLTGKLTLAETYWRTNPLNSWKMCLVGDPLYTPYKISPALEAQEVPERLRPVLESAVAPGR